MKNDEVKDAQILEVKGPAGTAFLFDTSAIHRQGVPVLETRQALFYNYQLVERRELLARLTGPVRDWLYPVA
ncbi:MAG TPA: hypothetical protein VLQ90_03620 [Pyrinomonadaceae bacterium]|nr:hypothetical protein [Pyrinomonadaceae bacterium]